MRKIVESERFSIKGESNSINNILLKLILIMTNSNRINHKSNKFSSYEKLITLKQFVKFEDNKLLYLFSDIL